jgi:hypothetical protein
LLRGIKGACFYKDRLVVATKTGVFMFDNKLKIVDTLYVGRTVSVACDGQNVFIGSMAGLHIYSPTAQKVVHTYLKMYQINEINFFKGIAYIGTERGVFLLVENDRIEEIKVLNDRLKDKNINCIVTDSQFLFVGTNDGLFRLAPKAAGQFEVVSYKTADGLPDNKINAIHIVSSTIYVGTPNGDCNFDIHAQRNTSICTLNVLSFSESGKSVDMSQPVLMGANARNIKIEFVAVAPKSNGEVTYFYQLEGFDDSLQTTTNGYLEYAKLPPGDYHLKIYATNKNGVQSATKDISFSIEKPFWQRWWFLLSALLLVGGFVYLLFRRRLQKVRAKMTEQERIKTLIAESEQKALRAQMNPHFIYNCLNSIQQFFITNDLENGNRYMTRFGSLLRQTLHNSEKQYITIQEEVNYIKTYIELEQLRFSNSFSYSVNVDDLLLHNSVLIPSMVIQPFVENAIEHGLRYKTSGHGILEIQFTLMEDEQLIECEIIDNGIGLKRSAELKASKLTTHQSKGINITKQRLQVLNMGKATKASIHIQELFDEDHHSMGVKVTLRFPFVDA